MIEFECSKKNVSKVIKLIDQEIDKIQNGVIKERDFNRARNMILSGYKYMYESSQPHIDFQSLAHHETVAGIEWEMGDIMKIYQNTKIESVVSVAKSLGQRLTSMVERGE